MAKSGTMRHPKALYYLFFVELWERFSYYGMRAILVLFLVNRLFQDLAREEADGVAYGIYAAFGALVYATPVVGGALADKILGYRRAIIAGSLLMALGLFLMAAEQQIVFFGGLGFLVVGNGLFKPNISSMVGGLYEPGDPRRDSGFTIFYMGINLGALISPLACAGVAGLLGFAYGFGLAGFGMLLGLGIFLFGIHKGVFKDNGLPPIKEVKEHGPSAAELVQRNKLHTWAALAGAIAVVPAMSLLIYHSELAAWLLVAITVTVVLVVLVQFITLSGPERKKICAIFVLALPTVMFWAFFEQGGSSLTLFAERNVNLFVINAGQTNAINPLFIIALAIPFSAFWTWLSGLGLNPSTPMKFALGIAQLGFGFLLFAVGARFAGDAALVPMVFLVLGYFLLTTGELFISPIGLSMVTRLSPKKLVAFMMGVWFLAMAFAHQVAGVIARLTTSSSSGGDGLLDKFSRLVSGLDPVAAAEQGGAHLTLISYTTVFSSVALVAFGLAVVVAICSPLIRWLMHGEH